MKISTSILIVLFLGTRLFAQPISAAEQKNPIAIKGGTIHCANGKTLENGVIAFENGKITVLEVGMRSKLINQDKYTWIDATGKQIYPGLIAMNTQLGLKEIEAVRATSDFNELGAYNPNVRVATSYNTDSQVLPTIRSNGILMAQVAPEGGVISGTAAVMELDGWNWEDAVYKKEEGVFMNWPYAAPPQRDRPENLDPKTGDEFERQVKEIKTFLDQASAYNQKQIVEEINLRFQGMKNIFNGTQKLYVRANTAREIQSAVTLLKEYKIVPVIVGGQEAWRITRFLKDNKISVVYTETQRLPQFEDDDVAQAYEAPAQLANAGVDVIISVDGFWQVRNLAFQVGQAIPFGLNKESALDEMTINAARMLGIDKTTGSLEIGKDATLIISDGDIFDMRTNNITRAFIRGKDIDLDNKQKQLYKKYKQKYGL